MAANINPIYSRTPDVQGIQTSNLGTSTVDGTGSNVVSIFQADTTEGGYVDSIILKPIGSPGAAVARIFVYTGTGAYTPGTSNTTSNTFCIVEAALAAVTASTTTQQNDIVIPIRRSLGAGQRLLLGMSAATGASTGYAVTVFGGKY